jgi:hypothetical protein
MYEQRLYCFSSENPVERIRIMQRTETEHCFHFSSLYQRSLYLHKVFWYVMGLHPHTQQIFFLSLSLRLRD